MMTRSIVGRFLILAVLLVSLGVIVQAALIISKSSAKAVAKADAPAPAALPATPAPPPPVQAADAAPVPVAPAPATQVAPTPTPQVAPAPVPQVAAASPAADAAPVRVVYPGPLGDGGVPPRKFVAAAAPVAPPAAPVPAAAPQTPPAPPAPAVAAASPKPAVVVASADADTQPLADPPAASKGGVNLNSASVDALNHLGGGHIGQSIVQHRPYRSVEDLVKKRVVRRSVYEQIKNQVAAQ